MFHAHRIGRVRQTMSAPPSSPPSSLRPLFSVYRCVDLLPGPPFVLWSQTVTGAMVWAGVNGRAMSPAIAHTDARVCGSVHADTNGELGQGVSRPCRRALHVRADSHQECVHTSTTQQQRTVHSVTNAGVTGVETTPVRYWCGLVSSHSRLYLASSQVREVLHNERMVQLSEVARFISLCT